MNQESLIIETPPLQLSERKKKARITALFSALYAGAGYLYLKQRIKGALYMTLYTAMILITAFVLAPAIKGFITLGEVPMQDHSLILLVFGIIAFIFLGGFIVFYVSNIVGAYKTCMQITSLNYEKRDRKSEIKVFFSSKTPLLFMFPGLLAVFAVVILPLLFSICLGFTSYDANHQPPRTLLEWVGLTNFKELLSLGAYGRTFVGVLGWTLLWTVLSSVCPYAVGILIAMILSSPKIRCKKFFKVIYILPWAIPGYISIMILQSMFDTNYGLINQFLGLFSIDKIPWLTQKWTARAALVLVSVWTGFSFPMMLSESIIGGIPPELFEAAKLDGANSMHSFKSITFPLLMFSISPMFLMSLSGAFNNFNMIYLFTEGNPMNINYQGAGDTDILISWLFKITMNNQKYNYGSAIALILFLFIATFSIFNLRRTRNFKEEDLLT